MHDGDDDYVDPHKVTSLLEILFHATGFDFRSYTKRSVARRLNNFARRHKLDIDGLTAKILEDESLMQSLTLSLTIGTTTMFRDPEFFSFLRTNVLPILSTYPFIRIWHAGCSTGQEVYSMAILLKESGLYNRSIIYATDLDPMHLEGARHGIYPLQSMRAFTDNYYAAGGCLDFSSYYTAAYGKAMLDPALRDNIVFAQHNLVSDSSFNEFNLIFCRNVLIYFNRELQESVLQLFHDSLSNFGILALGDKESLLGTPWEGRYTVLSARWRIFQRKHL